LNTLNSILLTADTLGGVWQYTLALAKGLSAAGTKVHVATMGALPTAAQTAEAGAIQRLQLHTSAYKLEWMPEPWADVDEAGEWLLQLERELQPDIVQLNGFAHGRLAFSAPKIVVGHSCVSSWFKHVQQQPLPDYLSEYHQRVKAGIAAADSFVAVSEASLADCRQFYGSIEKAEVIYNGKDAASPADAFDKQDQIFAMGRYWDEAKNLQLLAEIAPLLKWPLRIAGATSADTAAPPQHPNLQMLGQLKARQVQRELNQAKIFASPALYEPFGLGVLEAALSGCALALAPNPTFKELWPDAAYFVKENKPEAWADALNHLSENAKLRSALAAKAKARAQQFSTEKFISNYQNLYARLLQAAAVPSA
jgi:glycosyltransferase involved in cell wall biosynthesis